MKFNKKLLHDIMIGAAGSMTWTLVSSGLAWAISAISSKSTSSPTFMDVINMNIPIWILFVVIGIIIFILIFCKRLKQYPFLECTSMKIGCFKWEWTWKYDEKVKKYTISDIGVYCPKCGKVLTCNPYTINRPNYSCINQHFYHTKDINYTQTVDNIIDEIRAKFPTYRNKIAKEEYYY